MRFEILGPLQVRLNDAAVAVAGTKRRALLIGLLAYPNSVVTVDRLLEWIWPRDPPPSAAFAIQAHVSVLRATVEPDRLPGTPPQVLITAPNGYLLRVTHDELDTLRFAQLIATGRAALKRGDAQLASRLLGDALALWRGPPLSDVRYVDAAQAEIARLEELHISATVLRIDADLRQRRYLDVVPELARLVIGHPLHERFYGQLMIALVGCGRRADALDVFRQARRVLAEELAVGPGPDLYRLRAAILAGETDLHLDT